MKNNTRKARNIKRLFLVVAILVCTIGVVKSINWVTIGDNGSVVESIEVKGPILSHSDAMEKAKNYDREKEYFYKYYIEKRYVKSTFPFVEEISDTVDAVLWEKKKK